MPQKKCTVQYRYMKPETYHGDRNLQSALAEALNQPDATGAVRAENARLRVIDLDQDENFVILNKLSDPNTWSGPIIAGQLIQLQQGTQVPAIMQSLEDDTDEFLLQQLEIEEEQRVLRGVLYFVANGSHVGVIEGHLVRGKTLERYFTRLLQDVAMLEPGQVVTLNKRFSATDGKEVTEIKEMSIRAGSPEPVAATGDVLEQTTLAQGREEGNKVFDVLRALGWSPEAIAGLERTVPEGSRLEGFFKFSVKNRRSIVNMDRAMLDEAFRHIDPDDLGLTGDGREKAGMVTISMSRLVEASGQLLNPEDALRKIVDAMKIWAEDGKIDCQFDT